MNNNHLSYPKEEGEKWIYALKQYYHKTQHELKWRYVNAEITCRPITGIIYQEFLELL